MTFKKIAGSALVVTLGAVVFACGSSWDDYCTKLTQCQGGNDKDKQACIDAQEAQKKEASDYGCGSQFNDYQSCQSSGASCQAGKFTAATCDTQRNAVETCVSNASSIKK